MIADRDIDTLSSRLKLLEAQLQEANETLDAIRNGEVDAVVVGGPAGQVVYTLENADRPYRVLVERMQEGAVTLAEDGAILYCNRSFAQLVRGRSETIIGRSLSDYFEDTTALERLLALSGAGSSAELSLRTLDGDLAPVILSVVELQVEDGGARMLSGILTDLTENHERAQELADANGRLSAEIAERGRAEESLAIALDAADMGSWDFDLATGDSIRSARHDDILGLVSRPTKLGVEEGLRRFVPEDRAAVEHELSVAATTGRLDFERRIKRETDGALRWIHVKGRAIESAKGGKRLTGIILDITERRLIDEQLRQAQKMEAVGQLTGGIAHDFNNLLMIIGGSLQTLSRRVTLGEREQRLFDAALLGVARGAKLNEQLLAFARRQDMNVETICVDDLLPTFETLLDRAMGETISVDLRRQDELWYCSTDPHQLETAILNLAINARDAMPTGGDLVLSTRNVTVSESEAARWEAAAGEYVSVSIADTGIGMDAELLAHVFEPFFTTKGVGEGTGLGLSQVYGFAKQSGGFVGIESTVGKGATVSIYLPRAEPHAHADKVATPAREYVGSGTILLVEDDADVRAASCAMIEELGYSVRQADGGHAALHSLATDDNVDCVFSDVIMAAGMTGVELAECIRDRHPTLPVLLTSGYNAPRMISEEFSRGPIILRKPFTMEELGDALRRAIHPRAAA